MFGLRTPLFPYRTTQDVADAAEARTMRRYADQRERHRELRGLIDQAARTADAVARLEQQLRSIP